MLKMVKIQINLEVKADKNDPEDLRDRVYDKIQLLIEDDDLPFVVEDEENDEEFELED